MKEGRKTLLIVACPFHPKWVERAEQNCAAIGVGAISAFSEDAMSVFKTIKPDFVVVPTNGLATPTIIKRLEKKNTFGAKIATLPIEKAPTIADIREVCKK